MIAAPYFTVDLFELKEPQDFQTHDASGKRSAQILVAVEGCGIVEAGNKEPVMMAKGDAVVVPASAGNFHVQPQWEIKFIKSFVPGSRMPEPETRM